VQCVAREYWMCPVIVSLQRNLNIVTYCGICVIVTMATDAGVGCLLDQSNKVVVLLQ